METKDWLITVLRGLSVGAITFLVASGLSLIFGLMDVLNLAHGELFMLGAYVGWTVFVRPDTFVDVLPMVLAAVGLTLLPVWLAWLSRAHIGKTAARIWPWIASDRRVRHVDFYASRYPITIWDPDDYAKSPITFLPGFEPGNSSLPEPVLFGTGGPAAGIVGCIFGRFCACRGDCGTAGTSAKRTVDHPRRSRSCPHGHAFAGGRHAPGF